MKHKNILFGAIALLIVIILVVIWKSSDKDASAPADSVSTTTIAAQLSAVTWVWTETLMNDDSAVRPAKKDAFSISFAADGTLSGTTDCNSFMSTYKLYEGGTISFGSFGMTKKACQGSEEAVFIDQLAGSNGFLFTEAGDLVLTLAFDSGSVMFRQKAAPAMPKQPVSAEPVGFANLSYRLIGYKNVSIPSDKDYTLTFSGANGLSAKFCNSMSGTYTESKGKISAPALASTLMLCSEPEDLMEIESAFGKALAEGVTVSVQGNYLTLTDAAWNRFTFELVR